MTSIFQVKKNLLDVSRVVSISPHPLLLQGDTSVGKTSHFPLGVSPCLWHYNITVGHGSRN